MSQPAGAHFNLPGNSLGNMKATIREQVKYKYEEKRKEREKYFIRKLETKDDCLNKPKKPGGLGGFILTFTLYSFT